MMPENILETRFGPEIGIDLMANILESSSVMSPTFELSPRGTPFLSVVLRTQGLRIEQFKDALLCLSAQTSDDFEVIVVLHDPTGAFYSSVAKIIASFDNIFSSRIRLLHIQGGNRSSPLNLGLGEAKGRYVSFFDDDDYLFAHWVESFKVDEKIGQGKILRAQCVVMDSGLEEWPENKIGTRSLSWPTIQYPQNFSFVDHLVVNKSPFMSLAFPMQTVKTFSMKFNEELLVCEDWDFLLRVAHKVSVHNIPKVTSIYRRWENNVNTSYSLHGISDWQSAERQIREYWNSKSVIIPPGSVERLMELSQAEALERYSAANVLAYQNLQKSFSWKVLSPLRFIRRQIRRVIAKLAGLFMQSIKKF